MKILGIVAEYDPFHRGHLFHLTEAQKQVSPDLTLIVLSPCVKQRGELSLLSPADRARCALKAGADAVFSLPVCWTVRDAEHYALGAVSLLARLGATHLAFGAETADPDLLSRAADLLESPTAAFSSGLKDRLSGGVGWPAAVSAALSSALPEADGLLDRPNNILAVSYLRAVRRLGLFLEPVAVPRSGSYHAAAVDPCAPSASALREALRSGSYAEAASAVPEFTAAIIRRRFLDSRIPDERVLDSLLLSKLRSMDESEYAALPGLSEGLENALRTAAAAARSRRELISSLSGKRYPAARVSRLCACALLGLRKERLEGVPLPENTLLLGLRKRPEMTALWKSSSFPVISSFPEWKKAADPADLAAWRLWAQCCRLPDSLPFTEKTVTVE
ncbi:MAG: nucleotidyltransferase family protein [Clostridiales bacterium]|nr:nucleotidyltransferase family protein [Clostridiales bacterium]